MTTYLFLGYTVVWTALFVYFLQLSGREQALEREVRSLKERLGALGTD